MGSNNEANLQDVISGIYWAIENDIKILNMSFGTSEYSEALQVAVNDAINAGVLIIASAGNGGTIRYPAAFPGVIAVGSIDHSGEIISENVNDYSEILLAPGEEVLSVGDFATTISASGTSMATPHVTAVAAALWEMDTQKSNMFIKDLLFATANTSLGEKVLDAEKAIEKYAEFSANYNEYITPLPYPNTTEITTFDDVTFEALWHKYEHDDLVWDPIEPVLYTRPQIKMLKIFSQLPDINKESIKEPQLPVNLKNLYAVGGVSTTLEKDADDLVNDTFVFTSYFKENGITTLTLSNNSTMNVATDERDFGHYRLLHARGNYVTSLRYLYTVAQNLWTESYYKTYTASNQIDDIILAAINDANTQVIDGQAVMSSGAFYNDTATYGGPKLTDANPNDGDFIISGISYAYAKPASNNMLALQRMIYLAAACKSDSVYLSFQKEGYINYNFQKEAAIKILGISLHLLGDVYAHKSVIPSKIGNSCFTIFNEGVQTEEYSTITTKTIYKGSSGKDFNRNGCWEGTHGIKTMVEGGAKITTYQLCRVWQYGGLDEKSNLQGDYEDSRYFLDGRYEFATLSIEYYMHMFDWKHTYGERFEFSPIIFDGEYTGAQYSEWLGIQRLGNLRLYVQRAGFSIANDYLKNYDSKVTFSDEVISYNIQNDGLNPNGGWFNKCIEHSV